MKTLVVATPLGARLQYLSELALIVPREIDPDERNIPLDLTPLSPQVVGQIHSEFAVRQGYALFQAAVMESRLIELRRSARLAKASFHARRMDEKKTDRDIEATLDPEILTIEDHIAEVEAQLTLIQGVIGGYEKIREGASREMTRRIGERTSRGD